jgi:hypothetical protein
MNHIRKFLSYKENKNSTKIVNESVLQVDDTYKVRVIVDVKKSMVNSYIKKVSDNTQKNLRDFYSDMDIVEELVKHVVESGMNVDTIPATLLVGGSQTQAQPAQSQPAQVQTQTSQEPTQDFEEVQPQTQTQAQPQAQVQTQNQGEEEEEDEEEELPQ